jgi:hypothetical protein
MELRSITTISVEYLDGKTFLGEPWLRWKVTIKVDIRATACEDIDWIYLAKMGTNGPYNNDNIISGSTKEGEYFGQLNGRYMALRKKFTLWRQSIKILLFQNEPH